MRSDSDDKQLTVPEHSAGHLSAHPPILYFCKRFIFILHIYPYLDEQVALIVSPEFIRQIEI